MHEGLCILSKTDRPSGIKDEVLFCNRPARKLFSDYKQQTEATEENFNLRRMEFAPIQEVFEEKSS